RPIRPTISPGRFTRHKPVDGRSLGTDRTRGNRHSTRKSGFVGKCLRSLNRKLNRVADVPARHSPPMSLAADYHMHTPLCQHATGEPVEYAAHALKVGLKEIGFSDHSPMRRDDFDNWRMRFDQLDEYVDKVRRARHEF